MIASLAIMYMPESCKKTHEKIPTMPLLEEKWIEKGGVLKSLIDASQNMMTTDLHARTYFMNLCWTGRRGRKEFADVYSNCCKELRKGMGKGKEYEVP